MSEICSDYRRIVTDLVDEWSENEEFPPPTEIIQTKVYYNSSQINGVKHARFGVDNTAPKLLARDLPEMNKSPSLKDVEDYVLFRMAQCNTHQSSASEGFDTQLQKESVDVQAAPRENKSDLSGEIPPSLTPTRRSHVQSANGKYVTRETDEEWVCSSEIKGNGEGKFCRIGSVDLNDSTHSRISDSSVSIDSLAEDQKTRQLESPSSVPKDESCSKDPKEDSKLSKDLKGKKTNN
ncbi:uncharacterized protein [Argopecten irradians]|uniref:uncharacterized protein n=1 Tax=Argopecten irradians TaxID=31199 RepID=UPI003712A353